MKLINLNLTVDVGTGQDGSAAAESFYEEIRADQLDRQAAIDAHMACDDLDDAFDSDAFDAPMSALEMQDAELADSQYREGLALLSGQVGVDELTGVGAASAVAQPAIIRATPSALGRTFDWHRLIEQATALLFHVALGRPGSGQQKTAAPKLRIQILRNERAARAWSLPLPWAIGAGLAVPILAFLAAPPLVSLFGSVPLITAAQQRTHTEQVIAQLQHDIAILQAADRARSTAEPSISIAGMNDRVALPAAPAPRPRATVPAAQGSVYAAAAPPKTAVPVSQAYDATQLAQLIQGQDDAKDGTGIKLNFKAGTMNMAFGYSCAEALDGKLACSIGPREVTQAGGPAAAQVAAGRTAFAGTRLGLLDGRPEIVHLSFAADSAQLLSLERPYKIKVWGLDGSSPAEAYDDVALLRKGMVAAALRPDVVRGTWETVKTPSWLFDFALHSSGAANEVAMLNEARGADISKLAREMSASAVMGKDVPVAVCAGPAASATGGARCAVKPWLNDQ